VTSTFIIGFVFAALVFFCGRVATALVTDEVKGWLPYAPRALLKSAARQLPDTARGRWLEEWEAELLTKMDRPLTALAFAVRVRVNARAMAVELAVPEMDGEQDALAEGQEAAGSGVSHLTSVDNEALTQALGVLSYRERRVLELRYGLGGEHPRTLDEVGRTFNVTSERVRQIENLSVKKLQSLAEAPKLRDVT
jgi:RNA polymerase sigma factor (sigma-70 family)